MGLCSAVERIGQRQRDQREYRAERSATVAEWAERYRQQLIDAEAVPRHLCDLVTAWLLEHRRPRNPTRAR